VLIGRAYDVDVRVPEFVMPWVRPETSGLGEPWHLEARASRSQTARGVTTTACGTTWALGVDLERLYTILPDVSRRCPACQAVFQG
jgi:hypothetical protein